MRARFSSGPADPSEDWNTITADELLSGLTALVDRGTEVLLVYTGRVQVELFPEADHVFSRRADRRRLTEIVSGWARKLS